MIPDFYKEPKFTKAYPFDSYVKEKRNTEDRLGEALGAIWTPNDDFQVGYDTNRAFALCGGVYSPRVICQDYLSILFTILQATRMKDKWMYSTSVELPCQDGASSGSFALQGATVFCRRTFPFDFVKCFSRSRAEAEREGSDILRK
jgi:hypothetical protein